MQSRLVWLLGALVLALALYILDSWALAHHLYYTHRWVDIPMHLLGGLTIAVFAIGLLGTHQPRLFVAIVVAAFLGWEAVEYLGGVTRNEPGFLFDTAHDLVNDVMGGALAYGLARVSLWR